MKWTASPTAGPRCTVPCASAPSLPRNRKRFPEIEGGLRPFRLVTQVKEVGKLSSSLPRRLDAYPYREVSAHLAGGFCGGQWRRPGSNRQPLACKKPRKSRSVRLKTPRFPAFYTSSTTFASSCGACERLHETAEFRMFGSVLRKSCGRREGLKPRLRSGPGVGARKKRGRLRPGVQPRRRCPGLRAPRRRRVASA